MLEPQIETLISYNLCFVTFVQSKPLRYPFFWVYNLYVYLKAAGMGTFGMPPATNSRITNLHIKCCHSFYMAFKGKKVTFGSSMKVIASTNFGSENSSTAIGAGPTPLACTRSPQKGWSPKKGTIVVGH